MCTWASARPGIRVRPLRSTVSTFPGSGPTLPEAITSLMRSPSTTTAAPSTGSLPVQSIRNAFVNTVIAMERLRDLGYGGQRRDSSRLSRDAECQETCPAGGHSALGPPPTPAAKWLI